MTLEADIGLVDELEAAEVSQPVRTAEPVRKGGRVAVAVTGLVEGEHHVAAAGELDGKAVLGLARIDVTVDRQNPRGRNLWRRVGRDVEQGTHGIALGTLEPDVLNADAAGGLGQVSQQSAGQDEDDTGNRQRPSAAHRHLPFGFRR